MRVILVTCLLLAVAVLGAASPASAQPTQPPGPLVGQCNFITKPCWDGALACVWISLQLPVCLTSVQ